MTTILAIDAAWTATEPSGVAVVQEGPTGWRCLGVAPSYQEFFAQTEGRSPDWITQIFRGTLPDAPRLLDAAGSFAGEVVDLVTLDMPVATVPFSSRRPADDAVSVEFGTRWCSAHTPNAVRPGPLGDSLSSAIRTSGYELATTRTRGAETKRLVEVYPHPALLSLLRCARRVPYKVRKSRKYWPQLNVRERIAALLREFDSIYQALQQVFGSLGFELPRADRVPNLAHLKRYEDALDALVCAWVGVEYLSSRAVALGDETGAIWCPADVVHGRPIVRPNLGSEG